MYILYMNYCFHKLIHIYYRSINTNEENENILPETAEEPNIINEIVTRETNHNINEV